MNKIILTSIIVLSCLSSFGQQADSLQKAEKYVSPVFGYSLTIPSWLKILNTGHQNLWGGTLLPINGIENAIVINGFKKDEYKNLKKLKYEKVEKYKMGDKINVNQTFLLRQDLGIIENIGDGYKVQMTNKNVPYHCMFVFTETSAGYLWIIFTATPETYDINVEKFKEFLRNLEISKR